jgi:predicted nucleic acid-binding Zn finger protein
LDTQEKNEAKLIAQICKEMGVKHSLEDKLFKIMERSLRERFQKAFTLVRNGAVKRYLFKPSGRVIWEVTGRKSSYQVMPHTDFCSCDDYYFRVMNSEKQLCYHIIAQRIALALNEFEKEDHRDRDYGKVTKKWKRTVK